ncbi:hypothetical protein [Rhizobium tumorigenes]|uniref:hypothetical protein n=1 Tax=Rhizobium tumorigenes TaxID=2041385 RepID=UPI00241CD30B|nr:hypothetical protein [Rhizobium tumorigenes]WFS01624.1 hypothetical protein PR016_03025 [Rhizobium tumorigenes]WFS02200.1 hypothetical protein PR016_06195 [Rhizobium tumorigenes]
MGKRSRAQQRSALPGLRTDPLQLPVMPQISAALQRNKPATSLPQIQPREPATSSMTPQAVRQTTAHMLEAMTKGIRLTTEAQHLQDLMAYGTAPMMVPMDPHQPATALSILEMQERPPFHRRLQLLLQEQELLFLLQMQHRQVVRTLYRYLVTQPMPPLQMTEWRRPWMLPAPPQAPTMQERLQDQQFSLMLQIYQLGERVMDLLEIPQDWRLWIHQRVQSNMVRPPPFFR